MAIDWSKRHNIDAETIDLTNAHEAGLSDAPAHPEVKVEEVPAYPALTSVRRRQLMAVTLICAAMCFIPAREEVGAKKQVTVKAASAIAMASKYLSAEGDEHKDYMSVAQMLVNPNATKDSQLPWQHIYEKLGLTKLREVYRESAAGLEWQVRFFKPLDPRSYQLYLNGDGTLRSIVITDDDEAPGAKLDDDQALAIAESFLNRYRSDFTPFTLDTKSKIAQSKRVDYNFDFLVPKLAAGETPAVVHVDLMGDKVSNVSGTWRIPDSWAWPRKQAQWYEQVLIILRFIALTPLSIGLLIWSVHILRTTRVPWRLALSVGLVLSAVVSAGIVNSSVSELLTYKTAKQFESFVSDTIAERAIMCLMDSIGCLYLSIVALSALQKVFPDVRQQLHNWVLLRPSTAEQKHIRSQIWIDAAISSYALTAAVAALKMMQQLVNASVSPVVPLDIPSGLATTYCTSLPILQVFVSTGYAALSLPLWVVVLACLWRRCLRNRMLAVVVLAIAAVLVGADSWYWQACLIKSTFLFIDFLVIWFFARNIFAQNSLSYVFAAGLIASAMSLSEILIHASRISVLEIGVLVTLMLAPAVLAIVFYLIDRSGAARGSVPPSTSADKASA